jgi:hypothetical protein
MEHTDAIRSTGVPGHGDDDGEQDAHSGQIVAAMIDDEATVKVPAIG